MSRDAGYFAFFSRFELATPRKKLLFSSFLIQFVNQVVRKPFRRNGILFASETFSFSPPSSRRDVKSFAVDSRVRRPTFATSPLKPSPKRLAPLERTRFMFFLALLTYPVLEIAVFLLVAGKIGWASTLLFALATSFFGVYLLRTQGTRASFAQRAFSTQAVENYLYGNLGALLLILPGFVSDVFGALLLFAPTRRAFLGVVRRCGVDLSRQANGPFSVFRAYRFGDGFAGPFGDSNDFAPNAASNDDPIDVETFASTPESSATPSRSPSDDDPIDVEFVGRQ